jgi:hypothetical protein
VGWFWALFFLGKTSDKKMDKQMDPFAAFPPFEAVCAAA